MCTRYEDIYSCFRDDFSLYLTILIRDVNSNNIVYIFLFVICYLLFFEKKVKWIEYANENCNGNNISLSSRRSDDDNNTLLSSSFINFNHKTSSHSSLSLMLHCVCKYRTFRMCTMRELIPRITILPIS